MLSSSSDDSDISSSDSESSESSSEVTSSSDDKSKKSKSKKSKKKKGVSNWEVIAETWPVSERPPKLQKPSKVNRMTLQEIETVYNMTQKRNKALGTNKLFQAVAVETKHPTRKFDKHRDDCKRKLHPARFLRGPLLAPDVWYGKKVPIKRSPVIRELPLEYVGAQDQISERTIEIMHDRSKGVTLKEFYSGNHEVTSKGQKEVYGLDGERGYEFDWVSPKNLQGTQEALCNYGAVCHYLWPLDPTPGNIWRTLITYNWACGVKNHKLQDKIINEYFRRIMRKNANRAVRNEAPYCYDKHEETFKGVCRDNGINADNLLFYKEEEKETKRPAPQASKAKSSQKVAAKPTQAKAKEKRDWPNYNGVGVCFGFNSVEEDKKCKNTATEGGCKGKSKKGEEKNYAHRCSNWLGDKYCLGPQAKQACPAK